MYTKATKFKWADEDGKRGDRIQKIGEQGSESEGERGGENGRERDTGIAMYGTGIFPQKKPCFFLTFLYLKLIFVGREFSRAFLYACLSQGGHIKGAKLL